MSLRVFLVEDNPMIRERLIESLTATGSIDVVGPDHDRGSEDIVSKIVRGDLRRAADARARNARAAAALSG